MLRSSESSRGAQAINKTPPAAENRVKFDENSGKKKKKKLSKLDLWSII